MVVSMSVLLVREPLDEPAEEGHFNFFPDHFYMELILGLTLMIVLSALATIFPATTGPKADPLVTPEVIKPELIGALGAVFMLSLLLVQQMEIVRKRQETGTRRHAAAVPASSRSCVECHQHTSPGITEHWTGSTHAVKGVGCVDCHLAERKDVDAFDHYGTTIACSSRPNGSTCWTQYHNFHLAQARSPLFGAGGGPIRVDPTGAAGTDVGDEIDIMVNLDLTAHQIILIGFFKLYPGRFIRETGPSVSPELFCLQHQVRW